MNTLQTILHYPASPWILAILGVAMLAFPAYEVALRRWRTRRMLAIRLRLEESWQHTRTTLALLSLTRPENPPSPRYRQNLSGVFPTVEKSDGTPGARRGRKPRYSLRYIGRVR